MASKSTNDAGAAAAASVLEPMEKEMKEEGSLMLDDNRYHVLVEFAYKHLDFQMAELEAVLLMNGIILDSNDCRTVPLLNQDRFEQVVANDPRYKNDKVATTSAESSSTDKKKKSEATTSCDDQQQQKQILNNSGAIPRRPFCILSLPLDSKWVPRSDVKSSNDDDSRHDIASILLSRCVLVRSVMELYAMAPTIPECAASLHESWSSCSPSLRIQTLKQRQPSAMNDASTSWKMTIHTLGTTFGREKHEAFRKEFAPFFDPFAGNVQMKDPSEEYVLIREVELDAKGGAIFPRLDFKKQIIPENDARPPLACYFGRRLMSDSSKRARREKGSAYKEEYSLKKRLYLGPTSMDSELSFIMTNLGRVDSSSIVMDPFVGTGSILLSCALRGAYCMGTDIDLRVLRGTTLDPSVKHDVPQAKKQKKQQQQDKDVFSNFHQFGLPMPDLIRSDNAIYHRHFRKHEPLYNAILCDPPYGIRAGARKSGSRRYEVGTAASGETAAATATAAAAAAAAAVAPRPILDEHRSTHIAQTKPYPVQDVMADLLDMAARTLVRGGRLVYIIPSFRDFNADEDLPRHDCLSTVHICYQPLSLELGRHMVAMEKTSDYDVNKRDEYMSRIWKNGPASAEKCASIRQKILEAAKEKPDYAEKLAIRKKKRKETKEAKKKAKALSS